MFLKILLFVIGLIVAFIGSKIINDGRVTERYNTYKIVVGYEVFFIGALAGILSFSSFYTP